MPGTHPRAAASGLLVTTGSGPTADDNLVRVSKGELIVPAGMVSAGAVDHLRGSIPGFAQGGVVQKSGASVLSGASIIDYDKRFVNQLTDSMKRAMTAAMKQAMAQAAAAFGAPGSLGGPTSASARAAEAYAASRLSAYGWGLSQMQSLIPLWMGESGWNRLALNTSSGAYGIPQALPASKMGPEANPPISSASDRFSTVRWQT